VDVPDTLTLGASTKYPYLKECTAMDMNQYRRHLAKRQTMSGPPQARSLAVRLLDLPKQTNNGDRLDEVDSIYADLDSIPNLSHRNKKLLQDNLDELTSALKRRDFSEAEILIAALIDTLVKH
jgi:hypothetical protein